MIVTLKAFCEQTGFPKQMIKTHAKSGLLPYIPCGRRYLFDKEETLKRLDLLKAVPIYTPQRVKKERCRITNTLPDHEYAAGSVHQQDGTPKGIDKTKKENRCSGNCNG